MYVQTLQTDRRTGAVLGINRKKLAVNPYWLLSDPPNNVVTVPPFQSSDPVILSNSGNGIQLLQKFGCTRDRGCTVNLSIQDGQTQRSITNNSVHIDTIFGNGTYPYVLPEELYLDRSRALVAKFQNLDDNSAGDLGDNTIRLNILSDSNSFSQDLTEDQGDEKRNAKNSYYTMPYFFTFDDGYANVPADLQYESEHYITISNLSNFEAITLTATCNALGTDGGPGTVPLSCLPFTIQLLDALTGESLIDAPSGETYPVIADLMLGDAKFPYKFKTPRLFKNRQKIKVLLRGIGTPVGDTPATTLGLTVFLTIGGRAILER